MNHDHRNHESRDDTERKISRSKVVTIGFVLVIGYFLWTEHRAHVIQFLPFLLLAACPLMHLFMHHGHVQGHGQRDGSKGSDTRGER
ncbi:MULTISPECIES: DUF2933 domain-containing protein [unclassified Cupriavidus]|uniref:DUF2933 domain-containing protein n=1 Tax=unclassified Cupriavidus TaxID=2640874 RepID=UPI00048A892C|nr:MULTISPECIES: DUF2933 domain-containing protein [unclassified Cupriavidus]MBP0630710.1 DUF2933 domain-containing protein [Cupriavidus sp. AcVe19-1a]MBP0637372.1 DUF2933 domain-containing protein [Cupriavidus sp. AcVe19-6a]